MAPKSATKSNAKKSSTHQKYASKVVSEAFDKVVERSKSSSIKNPKAVMNNFFKFSFSNFYYRNTDAEMGE